MATPDEILEALDHAGFRRTGPRRALADLIARQAGHFTAAELVGETRSRRLGVGRATVFRTLEALEAVGRIERIDLPDRKSTRLNSSHLVISYAVFCLKKKREKFNSSIR